MNVDEMRRSLRGSQAEQALMTAHAAGGQIRISGLEEVLGSDVASAEAAAELRRLGLADGEASLVGETEPTGQGRQVANAIARSRQSGEDRWDRVERAIIGDLVEHRTRTADEWGVYEVDGVAITDDERVNAMDRLAEWGYLKGVRTGQADGFVRIDATAKASQVAGIGGLLADQHAGRVGPTSYTTNNSATMNVTGDGNAIGAQVAGDGNRVHGSASITNSDREALSGPLEALKAAMSTSADDTSALAQQVTEIEAEVSRPAPSKERLRDKVAVAIAGASVTQGLMFALPLLGQMLGIVS